MGNPTHSYTYHSDKLRFSNMTSSLQIISKSTLHPYQNSIKSLKLSVSDIPMLSCQYIQKGVLFDLPILPFPHLILRLKNSLSQTLSHFPPLAGRLFTDNHGHIHILCNDSGVEFIEAQAKHLSVNEILSTSDISDSFKDFFSMDRTLSYSGHLKPLLAVQVTELSDGVFIGCTLNHAVTDGTSFWHFFNTFAEICKDANKISRVPDFGRDTIFNSQAVLRFPAGGPKVTFSGEVPLRERLFHFSREAILKLKYRANISRVIEHAEILGKLSNDSWKSVKDNELRDGKVTEISSFQSLCAQIWRSVTRATKVAANKPTTFRMAVNCRHRAEPRLDPCYFGNAIQSIPTVAPAGEILSRDLGWCANLLHKNVIAHDDATVRRGVEDWEREPRLFPLGNADGASITMGSSPRFPMYKNDFGWGKPLAVRSGRANKFDGKISAFPGREGNGSVELEVVLAPETMAGIEGDLELMQYVSKRK